MDDPHPGDAQRAGRDGADTLTVEIWRGTEQGCFAAYRVPRRDSQTVLDVVTWVQRHLEPTLAYRFACRVGVCGSCAMMVNGRPRWTCRTHVSRAAGDGRLRLEPIANLPRIRDLVVEMSPFFERWQDARGRFEPSATRTDPLAAVLPESRERRAAAAAIECINCAVCYAACDLVGWQPEYLGPAALNRAWAGWNDLRDVDRDGILAAIARPGGCHSCHTQQGCAEHCPVEINPTASIAGLKRATATAWLRGRLAR